MQSLLSSPARLANPETISLLVLHLSRHLGRRFAEAVKGDVRTIGELDRLRIVPLVFGLLPKSAVVRGRYDEPIKPLLERHLSLLGISAGTALVDVLKCVADQYYRTMPGPDRPRKWGIAELKASDSQLYRRVLNRQEHRCVYCGACFDGNEEETLDHIVPWRIIGDIGEGTNWQIICRECNIGKAEYLSSLQTLESQNWIYSDNNLETTDVRLRTRYALLMQNGRCCSQACDRSPVNTRLFIVPRFQDHLPIADHYQIVCEHHLSS